MHWPVAVDLVRSVVPKELELDLFGFHLIEGKYALESDLTACRLRFLLLLAGFCFLVLHLLQYDLGG